MTTRSVRGCLGLHRRQSIVGELSASAQRFSDFGRPLFRTGQANIPREFKPGKPPDDPVDHIALPPFKTVSGRGWKGMMIVMPAFAKRQDGAHEVILALVFCFVRRFTKQMANGVDAPSGVVDQKNADEARPNNATSQC